MKVSTYVSWKENFVLYYKIHGPIVVTNFQIKLDRKDIILLSDAVLLDTL